MGDFYDIIPALYTDNFERDGDCHDPGYFLELFTKLVLGMQQIAGSGGVHTHPGARLLIAALCLLIDPKFAIETGCDAGLTTQSMAVAIRNGELIAIDNWSETSQAARERYGKVVLGKFSKVHTLENDALQFLKEINDESVDLIFLDDDHSEPHVRDEMIEIRRVLSLGGVAVFHDVKYFSYIEDHMRKIFHGWDMMVLPAVSLARLTRDGVVHNLNDMGIGIIRKPHNIIGDK